MSFVSCITSLVIGWKDRVNSKIVWWLCREVCQRCDMKGEVEIFVEDLEAEVYINSWDLFLEVVTSPFQVIVFVLWLQHTFPQDAWVYFKSIKSIYADRSTSVYHLMQMILTY